MSETPDAGPPRSFEQALEALEDVVRQLERGDLSLEDALGAFERGVGLVQHCRGQLDAAELRIAELVERSGELAERPGLPEPGT